jgi:hypothetical protein
MTTCRAFDGTVVSAYKCTQGTLAHRQKRTAGRQHESTGKTWLDHRRQATPDHHRRLGARRAVAALVSPGHSGPAGQAQSCLTQAGRRPVVWAHEIPDSGISHWNTGSSPHSGTEAGDISPVFAALEHAAGDFTTLGKNPLLGGSSPPSDTWGLKSLGTQTPGFGGCLRARPRHRARAPLDPRAANAGNIDVARMSSRSPR